MVNLYKNIFQKKWVAIVILLFLWYPISAQQNNPTQLKKEILQSKKEQKKYTPPAVGKTVFKSATPLKKTDKSLVYLEYSDEWMMDNDRLPNIQILKGNVKFRYDDVIMFCDSAYYDENKNTFDAFSNVKIVQGDTLTLYGDLLNYDGNTKLAQLQDNVKMVNRNTELTTETLYYDRVKNLAYYFTGGVIKNGKNTLTSMWAEYSPATKVALFKDQVKLNNDKGVLTADTLKYYTNTSIADIVGNSHIVYKNETDVYSEKGWYDTKTERMMLLKRSLIEQKDGKTLLGDTIFYDKKNRFGEAFSRVELNDPKQKVTLYGNYISYDEVKEKGLATDSALFVDWSEKEKEFNLSADTLYTQKDSISTDTVAFSMVRGYANVRFFREDLQGICDTLVYTSRDSVIRLNHIPVVWSKNQQLKGKTIKAFIKNKKVDRVEVKKSAIAIQKDSLNYYNQLAGKEIIAFMDSTSLKQIDVNGNVETIYFIKDDKTKEYFGVNKTISSFAKIFFKDKKLDRIRLTEQSNAVSYPLKDMQEEDLYLPNFHWFEKERPTDVKSLFTKFVRVEPKKLPISKKRPKMSIKDDDSDEQKDNKDNKNKKQDNQNFNNQNNGFQSKRNGNRFSNSRLKQSGFQRR